MPTIKIIIRKLKKLMTDTTTNFDFTPGKLYKNRSGKVVQHCMTLPKGRPGASRLTQMFAYPLSGQSYFVGNNGRYDSMSYNSGYDIIEEVQMKYLKVDKDAEGNLSLALFDTEKEANLAKTEDTVKISITTLEEFLS